jgi:hypothetical protein
MPSVSKMKSVKPAGRAYWYRANAASTAEIAKIDDTKRRRHRSSIGAWRAPNNRSTNPALTRKPINRVFHDRG